MNTPSLRLRPLAAAILCSLLAPAAFAQTATTTPVGFITVTIPAAVDASTATNATVSIPLYNTADYVSTVASLDGANQFTMTGAAWTAGAYANVAAPRLVRIKTSTAVPANIGRAFLITANTTSQLTVNLPTGVANINTVLSVGDSCEVVPANTLGSVFGPTAPAFQAGASAGSADNVLLYNGTNWETFYNNGTNWKKAGNLTNQNNTIIYPDEGLFITRIALTPLVLTFMGTVPSTAEQTNLLGAGSTFLGNRFPVDATLGSLGLQNSTNWTSGASANSADNVFLWNGTNWVTYYYTGLLGSPNNIWKKAGTIGSTDFGITPVLTGTSVFVTRNDAGSAVLTQNLPYTP